MSVSLQEKPSSSRLKLRVSASKSISNQENMNPGESEEDSIFPVDENGESFGDDYDGATRRPGKKRRLTVSQVKQLEKHFEEENKLEPDRKVGLAKELGLQPRQVAIWFQNRRARLKTKHLEKEYGSLKPMYDNLMAEYVNLLKQNEDLKTKINEMKVEFVKRKTKMDNLKQVEAMAVQVAELESLLTNSESTPVCNSAMATTDKRGEESSDKTDTFDSESGFNAENHLSLMEAGNSAQSDFSQNEEDEFTDSLFLQFFPKLEEEEEFSKSCAFGFSDEEQRFCFWPAFSSEL